LRLRHTLCECTALHQMVKQWQGFFCLDYAGSTCRSEISRANPWINCMSTLPLVRLQIRPGRLR